MAAWNGHVLPSTCQVCSGRWPMTQFMHIRSGGVRVDRAPEKLNHSFCLLLHACSYNSSLLWHLPGGATCLLTQFIYSFRNCPRATHKISRRTRNFTFGRCKTNLFENLFIGWIRNECADDSWNGFSFVICWSCSEIMISTLISACSNLLLFEFKCYWLLAKFTSVISWKQVSVDGWNFSDHVVSVTMLLSVCRPLRWSWSHLWTLPGCS